MDNKGQLSLEYVLITMIGILLLTLISFPLLNTSIDSTNDVIDSLNSKNELNKVVDAINYCYASGKGAKKVILLDFNNENKISLIPLSEDKSLIKSNIKLNGINKEISIEISAPVEAKTLSLNGFNKIAVQWSENSNKITIKKI